MGIHYKLVRMAEPFEYIDLAKWLPSLGRFQGPLDLAGDDEPLPDPTLAIQWFMVHAERQRVAVRLFGDAGESAEEWAEKHGAALVDVSRQYMEEFPVSQSPAPHPSPASDPLPDNPPAT
jgi:hypothetical protein